MTGHQTIAANDSREPDVQLERAASVDEHVLMPSEENLLHP